MAIEVNQIIVVDDSRNATNIANLVVSGTGQIDANSSNAALRITQTGAGNALVVEDSANPDATPFVIDANGRVVSGDTASYNATSGLVPQIAAVGSTNATASMGVGRFSNDVNQSFYTLTKSRSTTLGTLGGVVSSGDAIGTLLWTADDGTNATQAASITAFVDDTPGTNSMPGRLTFSTTANNASTPTERMRIDSAGQVGIGITPVVALDVLGVIEAQAAATQDAVRLQGRAGGTSSYAATITPTTLTASRTVTLPDAAGTVVLDTATQSLTNKTVESLVLNNGYTEEVYAVVDAAGVALSPTNGSIQTWTLGASRTPTQGTWASGQSMTLMINDGTAFTVTWTSIPVTWVGGTAPTLATTGFTVIELWKVGTTVYGSFVGSVA